MHVSDVSRQNVPLYVWLPVFINICVLMSHIYSPTTGITQLYLQIQKIFGEPTISRNGRPIIMVRASPQLTVWRS